MANIYWKTKAWLLRASTPKTHEVPRMGSSTATAFAVNLKEKWRWPLRGAGRRRGGGLGHWPLDVRPLKGSRHSPAGSQT